MRQKQVWRYYCDFCKKAGCGKHAMVTHEAHCCSNPNRVCRMCALLQSVQVPIAELIAALTDGGEKALRELLVQSGEGLACPVCILATLQQTRKQMGNEAYYQSSLDFTFDYKKESASAFGEINEERYANQY